METMRKASSLAELKKAYRKLAFENHPDRGGSEEKMKAINNEFESLFEKFKNSEYKPTEKDYEDCGSAKTASEYTDFVYNEYRWEGSRYDGNLSLSDICKKIKEYGKLRFPTCKFSVNKSGYRSVNIILVSGDFEAFRKDEEIDRWSYNYDKRGRFNEKYTDRCNEVMELMRDYAESYNYDNSDIMTDYFDVNFYLDLSVGSWTKAYVNTAKIVAGEKVKPTPTEKKIQAAVGSSNWIYNVERGKEVGYFLCERGDADKVYALTYSQPSIFKKRVEKMEAAGMKLKRVGGWVYGSIMVENWEEIEAKIAAEREAMRQEAKKEAKAEKSPIKEGETVVKAKVTIIDYSERAIAVVGDTKSIKDQLKQAGGRFNPRLTCGAGWIFSKARRNDVEEVIRKAC